MCDQNVWQRAIISSGTLYDALSADVRGQLDSFISRIMQLKEQLLSVALAAEGEKICRKCGGQCCLLGKYHLTVLDLLAYLKEGAEPLKPVFSAASACCPYGGENGCRMKSRFRPMTCVIFNCDLLEERMGKEVKQKAAAYEADLRELILRADRLTGIRLSRPALLV